MATPAIVTGTPVQATGASSTPSITYTPGAAGNRLVVCLNWASGRSLSTTDAQLTTYATQPTATYGQISWMQTTGTSAVTLNWTLSGSAGWRITLYEISGADTNGVNDVVSVNSHNGGSTTTFATNATATAANQLPLSFNVTQTNTVTASVNTFTQDVAAYTNVVEVAGHSTLTTNAQVVTQSITWSASTYAAFNALILVNAASGSATYNENFAVTGTGAPTLQNQVGKTLGVSGVGAITLQNQIGKNLSASGSGSVSLIRRIARVLSAAGSGLVTATAIRVTLLAFSIHGSGSVSLLRTIGKGFSAGGNGLVSITKSIARAFSVAGSAVVSAVVGKPSAPTVSITVPTMLCDAVTINTQLCNTVTLSTQLAQSVTLPLPPLGG